MSYKLLTNEHKQVISKLFIIMIALKKYIMLNVIKVTKN